MLQRTTGHSTADSPSVITRASGRRPTWTLVWSDEFDGDTVDRSKWDFDLGNGFFDYKTHRWIDGWGNEELQYYTRDPANVSALVAWLAASEPEYRMMRAAAWCLRSPSTS